MAVKNGTLIADGIGNYPIQVLQISYGLNIIAQEDQAATFKILYTRQVQTDTFALQVVFDSISERLAFRQWAVNYAAQAISPSSVGAIRVTVPQRKFDMIGVLTQGVMETTTPEDVLWPMTLQFNASQINSISSFINDNDYNVGNITGIYTPPSNDATKVDGDFYYPNSFGDFLTTTANPYAPDIISSLQSVGAALNNLGVA
jgi:hypothetical protein